MLMLSLGGKSPAGGLISGAAVYAWPCEAGWMLLLLTPGLAAADCAAVGVGGVAE
jgi:hypothetical protein